MSTQTHTYTYVCPETNQSTVNRADLLHTCTHIFIFIVSVDMCIEIHSSFIKYWTSWFIDEYISVLLSNSSRLITEKGSYELSSTPALYNQYQLCKWKKNNRSSVSSLLSFYSLADIETIWILASFFVAFISNMCIRQSSHVCDERNFDWKK